MKEINIKIKDIEKLGLSMGMGIKKVYPPIENLDIIPSKEKQTFNHENSYGYDNVTVEPIGNEYVIPEGMVEITNNGQVDVTNVKTANVNVYVPPKLQTKEVTPTKGLQVVENDKEYDGLDAVVVNPIPDEYIIPEGTLPITENMTYDVRDYAKVSARVYPAPNLQNKEVTPSEVSQNIISDEGYDGLGEVVVKPIPDDYIVPTGTKDINTNGYHEVTDYEGVNVDVVFVPNLQDKDLTISENGTQMVTFDTGYDGLNKVNITVDAAEDLTEELETYNNGLTTQETTIDDIVELMQIKGIGEKAKYAPRYISFYNYGGTELDNELENLDTSNITSFKNMFYSCVNIASLDLEQYNWNTSNVTTMENMFYGMQNVSSINFSNFDTSKLKSMKGMFYYCYKLFGEFDFSSLNLNEVTDVSSCFDSSMSRVTGCQIIFPNLYKVTNISKFANSCTGASYIDLSNAGRDGSGITDVASTFNNSTGATEINVSNMNVSQCKSFAYMFYSCIKLTNIVGLSTLNSTKVTQTNYMFSNCKLLTSIDLSGFTTTNVTNMANMFQNCNALMHLDIRQFDFTKVTSYNNMFVGVPADCEIIVADDTARNWVLARRSDFTNVKTVAEVG